MRQVDTNRPEPPEERPEWIVNLERAGSLAVEAASDGWCSLHRVDHF